MKPHVRKLFRRMGYDLVSFDKRFSDAARKLHWLQSLSIDQVFDVGANTGQWASWLRHEARYSGSVYSFEPLSKAYRELSRRASRDTRWHTVNCAMGNAPTTSTIHVSKNSHSSSLLSMEPTHLAAHPDSQTVGTETVIVDTLDNYTSKHSLRGKKSALKIDTQGFELEVLHGAHELLSDVVLINVEVSLAPLYKGQPSVAEMLELASQSGFYPTIVEPCDIDYESMRLLQLDLWLVRQV